MANDSTAQKRKKQKNCGSTTGYAGANKYGSTYKTCDELKTLAPPEQEIEGRNGGKICQQRRQ